MSVVYVELVLCDSCGCKLKGFSMITSFEKKVKWTLIVVVTYRVTFAKQPWDLDSKSFTFTV